MRDDHSFARPWMRDILAAWAFCCLAGFGGWLVDGGEAGRDPGVASYAGVHLPAQAGSIAPALSIEDEFAEIADKDTGSVADSVDTVVVSRQEVAADQRCWLSRITRRLL